MSVLNNCSSESYLLLISLPVLAPDLRNSNQRRTERWITNQRRVARVIITLEVLRRDLISRKSVDTGVPLLVYHPLVVEKAHVNMTHTSLVDVKEVTKERDLEVHMSVVVSIDVGIGRVLVQATPRVYRIDLPHIRLRSIPEVELLPHIVPVVMT